MGGWNLCWQMQAGARPANAPGTQPLSAPGRASAELARQHLLRPMLDVVCLQEVWKPSWAEWVDHALDGAAVLVPPSYDGPILVTDIDDTLRRTSDIDLEEDLARLGDPAMAVDGCHALVHACASLGVPVLYLTLGSDAIRAQNHQFLAGFPRGVLVDFPSHRDASQRSFFKGRVLEQLRRDFPRAWLVCLGDNMGQDPLVYLSARRHPRDSLYIRTLGPDSGPQDRGIVYFRDYSAIHGPLVALLGPTGFPKGSLLYSHRHQSSRIGGCTDGPRWGLVNGTHAGACLSTLYNSVLYRLVDQRVLPIQAGDDWHLVQLVRLAVDGSDPVLDILNVHAPHTTSTTLLERAFERVYGLSPAWSPAPHVVLLGNVNVEPRVPVLQLLHCWPGRCPVCPPPPPAPTHASRRGRRGRRGPGAMRGRLRLVRVPRVEPGHRLPSGELCPRGGGGPLH